MKMYSLYALVDPRTGKPFYVGATVRDLKTRLRQHIDYKTESKWSNSIIVRRKQFIAEILNAGMNPTIQLLEKASIRSVSKRERYYYHYFTTNGLNLLQSNKFFNYSRGKEITHQTYKMGFRFVAIRVKNEVYEKLTKISKKDRKKPGPYLSQMVEDHIKNTRL